MMRYAFSALALACLTALAPLATAAPAKEERKVVVVRDRQTLNAVVPENGQLYILPGRGYTVTKSKVDKGIHLSFDATVGIILQAVRPTNSPKGQLSLTLGDGRKVVLSVRTQKVAFENNYLILQ
ncbi:hypothetical protein [Elstera sp.]|jgi:hypothetical protein|uniref:hypothetical protein n=1 Tax=Elstera sp. TaxID=1916664 RepID=UPI0037C08AD3